MSKILTTILLDATTLSLQPYLQRLGFRVHPLPVKQEAKVEALADRIIVTTKPNEFLALALQHNATVVGVTEAAMMNLEDVTSTLERLRDNSRMGLYDRPVLIKIEIGRVRFGPTSITSRLIEKETQPPTTVDQYVEKLRGLAEQQRGKVFDLGLADQEIEVLKSLPDDLFCTVLDETYDDLSEPAVSYAQHRVFTVEPTDTNVLGLFSLYAEVSDIASTEEVGIVLNRLLTYVDAENLDIRAAAFSGLAIWLSRFSPVDRAKAFDLLLTAASNQYPHQDIQRGVVLALHLIKTNVLTREEKQAIQKADVPKLGVLP